MGFHSYLLNMIVCLSLANGSFIVKQLLGCQATLTGSDTVIAHLPAANEAVKQQYTGQDEIKYYSIHFIQCEFPNNYFRAVKEPQNDFEVDEKAWKESNNDNSVVTQNKKRNGNINGL